LLIVRLLRIALGGLIFDPQKALRIRTICLGFWDGLGERLGVRLLPLQ